MQIVIDIPEEVYRAYEMDVTLGFLNSEQQSIATWNLISGLIHGTPLPKGHGRLIDYGYVVDAIDDWVNAGEYRYTNATDYLKKRVANTPTTIEADKEGTT